MINSLPVEKPYAQTASTVSILRSILDGYPLSARILWEILANSDDAGASKQIFVFDQRNHATEGLYRPGLADTQGPALMAYNDAVFSEKDWGALSSIHDSSKVADESKIGKYGVGFRSVFNLTDTPQILSNDLLAMFDPLGAYFDDRGMQIGLGHVVSGFPNQLLPFGFFMEIGRTTSFPGTIIRCPFRNQPSNISDQVITPDVISELRREFIDRELEISCLFLRNIKRVEVHEISPTGISQLLAKVDVSRFDPLRSMVTVTVDLTRNQITKTMEYLIAEPHFSREDAVDLLSQHTEYDSTTVTRALQAAKFSPEVKIAVDVKNVSRGRLFTNLPLPIFTGFPVHVHALFGIDTSRAHLRHAGSGGVLGSQDHLKVQWNRMLFEQFIPQAWSRLIEEMVSRALVSDIFSIWAPERSSGEIEAYYSKLPGQLVNFLLAEKSAVWPVYDPQDPSTQFGSFEALVVASPTERDCVLQALAKVGVSFTRPPKYIFELLSKSSRKPSILTPEMAHGLLLDKVDKLSLASEKDQDLLLEYLLATKNVTNICDLPLVPVANGKRVAISAIPGAPIYTMLTRTEFDTFCACDNSAIPLYRLPSHVAAALLEFGPSSVNVRRLTVSRIVEYLSGQSNHLASCLSESRTDSSALRWLSRFWEWMGEYEHREELFPKIRRFSLVPSTNGLRTVEPAVFKRKGEPSTYTSGYLALGVPFLPWQFSDTAIGVLEGYGIAESIRDIPALLSALEAVPPAQLSQPQCEGVLKHLGSVLDDSVSPDRVQFLRNLPIFPVMTCSDSSNVVTTWKAIPEGDAIRSPVGRVRFVPLVDGISFVGLDNIAPSLIKFLEPTHSNTTENDVIELAVENLMSQPEHFKLSLLRHLTTGNNRSRIIGDVFHKLRSQAFVLAEDGEYHVPGGLVDPESDVSPLYVGCPTHQPSTSSPFCAEVVRCLRSLGMFQSHLNPEIVEERVRFISSNDTSDYALPIARDLLRLLGSKNMDVTQVQGISEKRWLPTNRGLCSAKECRHAAYTPPALFDKVLAILEPFDVPASLQSVFRWNEPLDVDLLTKQLDSLLDSEHNYDAVVEVVKEFGRRQWSDEDVDSLKRTVGDRQWIPTTLCDVIADVKCSVFKFSPLMIDSGFCQIKTDLKAEDILRRMGCSDHPSTCAIIDKLHTLEQDVGHVDRVNMSICLLRSFRDDDPTVMERRAELLIPDRESHLRPFSEIFFNDIGENYRLVNCEGHFIAHQLVDEPLASRLGLNRLGLRYAELRDIGPSMGQAPLTTVRQTLKQYTSKQFLIEFLANAADAKATEFKVALNLRTVPEKEELHVLSPAMEYLCRFPSLVVYNDSQFTQDDFEGICKTGIGGKQERTDAIGEFGLGVLTMYHFADLVIVISGSRVLFLDPAKKHLPVTNCASLILPLQHVRKYYKGHLLALDGLLEFSMTADHYNGTLFVLPLRQQQGYTSPDVWSPDRILCKVFGPFEKLAADCLLFSHIQKISCVTQTVEGVVNLLWSFRAQKSPIAVQETDYVVTEVEITKFTDDIIRWKTATTSYPTNRMPLTLRGEVSLTRKPSFAGLAAKLDGMLSDDHSFKFFSKLPLSTPTSLPMHVMASFKLSSDRRQIRVDGLEELQRNYNTWLLEDVIPPLYLFFLEHLLLFEDQHCRRRWPSNKGDTLSNYIVDSFYSKHLASSLRHVFRSLYSPPNTLTPRDAVLRINDDNIRRFIDLLAPNEVVELPPGAMELAAAAKLPILDTNFVKNGIMKSPETITSGSDFGMIYDIILYLTHEKEDSKILCGLTILPLEDGKFGTLNIRGTKPHYYLWGPKNPKKNHNFDQSCFVHPNMRTKDLPMEKWKLNFSPLNVSAIKDFVQEKMTRFSSRDASARNQWTESFWDSWEEYARLGLKPEHIDSFELVPTILPPKFVSLKECRDGDALLVRGGPATQELRNCLRELELPAVYVDGPIPTSLFGILNDQEYHQMTLGNVISAMGQKSDLVGALDDGLREAFAIWARKNINDLSDDQKAVAQTLPIWWSASRGAPRALRPRSEIQLLLPDKLALEDVAAFMEDCVADDAALTRLGVKRMVLDELPDRLRLPDVLDEDTLARYKSFYEKWGKELSSAFCQPLLVPTRAFTFQKPKDLFKRKPPFTEIFPEDSPYFVHSAFEEFENKLPGFDPRGEKALDMGMFKVCARSLDAHDPLVLSRSKAVFHAFNRLLPSHVNQPDSWREVDDIPFVPRRMDAMRKLGGEVDNKPGLELPPEVTRLDIIVRPSEVVKEKYEAVAWSQRACFEVQPDERVCTEYPDLGRPTPSEVIHHLRYLSRLQNLCTSQRKILLHDVQKVYEYLNDQLNTFVENEELFQNIFCALRDEALFLNIDAEDSARLNWVKGSSLVINCHLEGSMQGVQSFLHQFEGILKAAGAFKVHYPTYKSERDSQGSESGIWSSFEQLRRENALTDVVFIIEPTEEVPNPEPLRAHRSFLAISSEHFKNFFCQKSQHACPGCPLAVKVRHSWQSLNSFLDIIYTRDNGWKCLSLELLLDLLDVSNDFKVIDLFEDVQREIIERKLLLPDNVEKVKAVATIHGASSLLTACEEYEAENSIVFVKRVLTQ